MTTYTYHWLHIPTGKTGTSESVLAWTSREKFLERLNKWNAQQPGVWQYWE